MQAFADSYAAGETPIPCVTCNQQIKFSELLDDRARSWRPTCWPPATTSSCATAPSGPSSIAPAMPSATRATSCSPPRAPSSPRCCFPSGAMPQGRGARARARARPARRRQVGQPGHLLRAPGPLHQRHRAPEARRRRGRRHRARRRPRARPPRAASSTTRSASAAGSAFPAPRRCTSCASMRRPSRSWWGRARACTRTGSCLRNVNWLGDAPIPAEGLRRGRARALERAAAARDAVPVAEEVQKCCCATANTALLPGRRASSTPMPVPTRACARRRMDRARPEPQPSGLARRSSDGRCAVAGDALRVVASELS